MAGGDRFLVCIVRVLVMETLRDYTDQASGAFVFPTDTWKNRYLCVLRVHTQWAELLPTRPDVALLQKLPDWRRRSKRRR